MEKHPNVRNYSRYLLIVFQLFVAVDCSARTGERVKDLLMICYQLVANPVAPLYDAEHNVCIDNVEFS